MLVCTLSTHFSSELIKSNLASIEKLFSNPELVFRNQICLLQCKFEMLTTPKTTSQNREHYIVEVVVSERKDEQPQH